MSDKIRDMFAEIAGKYDLLNDVLSFGMHRLWKKKLIKLSEPTKNSKVLDLATGTGDIAFLYAMTSNDVTGIDLTPEMIEIAKKRSVSSNPQFFVGDALNINFDNNTFDIISISFGIRNVDDIRQALREMHRVLNKNGKIVILEFGQALPPFSYIYNFYSKHILPIIGRIISGSVFAYEYLPESSARFPAGDNFTDIVKELKIFSNVKFHRLFYGIAYIYVINK
ncbi:MAG TPA: bifunctional demethylmenaquinone methyltransferase/2-methoxy-6-polyprenyl-1,4-benzoquinol methylase UbiE [Candidatus Kapabacteria bacterium]|nr:bifunctional demethylmenaquinone methyltransferase/2-methoxy-6-polyprenyl-1,4-benzoquinol methylase UbiE [Candidatus Kapabacteria bacterium]